MTTNNKISNLVYSQAPFFIKNDHPNFIVFLEKYYEYLEQNGKTIDRLKNLQNLRDIDFTEDQFAARLYDVFLQYIPDQINADKTLILKYAKDFYRAKGSEQSVKFLLNILFNISDTQFYYPKKDILRASDGKWVVERAVRITDLRINNVSVDHITTLPKFKNRLIRGETSNASAIVETVNSFYDSGTIIHELRISNLSEDFVSSEVINASIIENGEKKRLTANLFSGIISAVTLTSGGTGYEVGTEIPVESNTGSGGKVVVSNITRGNLTGIAIVYSGAGFVNSNQILVTGGGGIGANATVLVKADGSVHPNSYSIVSSIIRLESNTTIGNLTYSNLTSSNINTAITNAVSKFVYANTGPVDKIVLINSGTNYSSLPFADVEANTRIRNLGILGRMEIVDGGSGYQIGDKIEFINVLGGYGTGAAGNVRNVNGVGTITEVEFEAVPGHVVGGSGYSNDLLPRANVISNTGANANVIVKTVLGDGEILATSTQTIGTILELSLLSGGSNYNLPPTLNLTSFGDGTAQAVATVISGSYEYLGRFINDDGMVSSFNYLENRDFYQNYSYVVRTDKPYPLYKKALLDLLHPGGMKIFGEYDFINEDIPRFAAGASAGTKIDKLILKKGDYYAKGFSNGSNISINIPLHGIIANDNVYVEFISGSTANLGSIDIINSGVDYANGYINIENGSGRNVNASITVNSTGHIIDTTIHDRGTTYEIIENLFANVSHLVTRNIASITIANSSQGFSNGFVVISGGSGRNANANVTVNATGAIVGVTINSRGTGYSNGDVVFANVDHLVGYNLATINIASAGSNYSNGYINFIGGSGFSANANVRVDSQGNIVSVTILNSGYGYNVTDATEIEANVAHLKTYKVNQVLLVRNGSNYSNGYVVFEGGSGSNANANVTVNPATGAIVSTVVTANGSGYNFDDVLYANVDHLITQNIANITINNSGIGYSNGYIRISGGTGNYANANVTVNATGAIVYVYINDRGTGYTAGNIVSANADNLLTHKINTITINNGGKDFSNGYIIFEGGSGRNANANVTVNATGAIVSVNLVNPGTGYYSGNTVNVKVNHLITYNVANLVIANTGNSYSNGFITFENGFGRLANANVTVNATGAIVKVTLFANGTGYTTSDYANNVVFANVAHLANTAKPNRANASIRVILQIGNPSSANLTANLIQYTNTANFGVTLQKGAGNATIEVALSANGSVANLPVSLRSSNARSNLTVSLQRGGNNANLRLNLQPEPLNTITNSIFLVASSNTDWISVQHPNTANIYGTAYAGIIA